VRHILRRLSVKQSDQIRIHGFALPLAMGLGLVMMALAATATIVAQSDRQTSMLRRDSSSSNLVTEGGIARLLVQLRAPQNSILLSRNYDSINSHTGKLYLGADGTPHSGDEGGPAVNQWTNYPSTIHPCAATAGVGTPNIAMSGSLDDTPGQINEYTLRAYRYNPTTNLATLLVEGRHGKSGSPPSSTYIMVKLSVLPAPNYFPGLLVSQTAYLQGRSILGAAGNLFVAYDDNDSWESRNTPYLNGVSAPGDTTRPTYLNAIFSGVTDGYSTNPVAGKIVTCNFTHTLPLPVTGSFVGSFDLNSSRTITAPNSGVNHYRASKIDLSDEVVDVDTTKGPVYIHVQGTFYMRGTSKIINRRSDGKPPRVGDLRFLMTAGSGNEIAMFDSACIQNAFIYNPESDLQIQTKGDATKVNACGRQASVEGVVWVEDVLSSRNTTTTRRDPDQDGDIRPYSTVPGTTPDVHGVRVPDDLSSLKDILEKINWPIQHKFGEIKSWQKVSP
jgi:hypothetical protein